MSLRICLHIVPGVFPRDATSGAETEQSPNLARVRSLFSIHHVSLIAETRPQPRRIQKMQWQNAQSQDLQAVPHAVCDQMPVSSQADMVTLQAIQIQ